MRKIIDERDRPIRDEKGIPNALRYASAMGRLPGPEYREHLEMKCKVCKRRARARGEHLWTIFDALAEQGVDALQLRDLSDLPTLARRLGVPLKGNQ